MKEKRIHLLKNAWEKRGGCIHADSEKKKTAQDPDSFVKRRCLRGAVRTIWGKEKNKKKKKKEKNSYTERTKGRTDTSGGECSEIRLRSFGTKETKNQRKRERKDASSRCIKKTANEGRYEVSVKRC